MSTPINLFLAKAYAQGVVYSGIYKFSTLPEAYREPAKQQAATYQNIILKMALEAGRITQTEHNDIIAYRE